ncbi:hypothetical protein [Nocardia sp. NPDC127526]|uniref:hypothetical protein n=1 Tax=Nocardia sp. NPDC127526 TaxID=3345393 RepID=UPI00362860BC
MSGTISHYKVLLGEELSSKLAERGLLLSADLSQGDSLWFVGQVPAVPRLTMAVECLVETLKGRMGMAAYAHLMSVEVAEVTRSFPLAARSKEWSDTDYDLSLVEMTAFNNYIKAGWYGVFDLDDEASVASAAEWVMQCVRGPVGEWFSQRDSLAKLVGLAKYPTPKSVDQANPDAERLRATVILCALNGRLADAAGLMGWYLQAGRFSDFDSFERATAFDIALRQRFPGYRDARELMA